MFGFLTKKVKALAPRAVDNDVAQMVTKVNDDLRFTPDLRKLGKRARHLMFVYNEIMTNQRKCDLIGHNRECAAITEEDNFVMWKKKLGAETFPFALQTTGEQKFGNSSFIGKPAKISGELYSVTREMIKGIDSYLLNGVQFERKRVALLVPYRFIDDHPGNQRIERVKAWMYVGPDEFWLDQLDAGTVYSQVKLYSANTYSTTLDKYYYFNENIESNTS